MWINYYVVSFSLYCFHVLFIRSFIIKWCTFNIYIVWCGLRFHSIYRTIICCCGWWRHNIVHFIYIIRGFIYISSQFNLVYNYKHYIKIKWALPLLTKLGLLRCTVFWRFFFVKWCVVFSGLFAPYDRSICSILFEYFFSSHNMQYRNRILINRWMIHRLKLNHYF